MNKYWCVSSLAQLLELKEFLFEGLRVLNDPKGGRGNVKKDVFFKVLTQVVNRGSDEGIVLVMTSPNDKLLAYSVLLNCTPPFGRKTAFCYAVYSNGKCPNASYQLLTVCERWAKTNGYEVIQAASRRMTGAAVRLFGRWGFRPEAYLFSKNI